MMPIQNQQQQEEDSDYDPFEAVRPRRIKQDNNPKDETEGEEIDEFAKVRPREDEIEAAKRSKNKQKKEFTALETAADVGKQGAKEFLIGVGGTWGDLAELAGVGGETEGQKNRNKQDFETLERINQPGYKPSFQDIASLGEEEIGAPQGQLPTSKKLREVNEAIGGPGKAETPAGRYTGRTANIYGSGVALGQVNPLPAVVAGVAGQSAEELGAGPLGQAAAEIAALILTPGQAGKKILQSSVKKEVADKINNLRKQGYSEKDITLAINQASRGRKGGIKATKGEKTEKAFEDFAEHSDDIVNDILENGIQGYEKGSKHIHEIASDAYGQVMKEATTLGIKKLDPFFDSMDATMKEIRRSIGHNPEAKNFMIELTEHTLDIIDNPTMDNIIDFYKRLGALGKWVGRNQKDRILTNVKESIKDTMKSEGKAGRELAAKFEKVNEGISKAYKAEDIIGIMDKATTQQGIDYNKLNKAFDNKDNLQLFQEVLGKKATDNLQMIAKTGKEVKNFDKSWKATNALLGNRTADIARGTSALYFIYKGDMEGLGAVLATKGVGAGSRKIAEEFLTNPRFQNLIIRGLYGLKEESPRAFQSANEAIKEYWEERGIKI